MNIITHTSNNKKIAEIISSQLVVQTIEDGVDLLGDIYYQGFDKVILYEKNISPNFFNLKTGMAGEILQKFSQYRMPLVIIGDFSKYKSNSLKDFIFESNKGSQINFLDSIEKLIPKH